MSAQIKTDKCAICGSEYGRYGHNPQPLLTVEERVCEDCNWCFIIPIRLGARYDITVADGRRLRSE